MLDKGSFNTPVEAYDYEQKLKESIDNVKKYLKPCGDTNVVIRHKDIEIIVDAAWRYLECMK
jgi:hypothetical protein